MFYRLLSDGVNFLRLGAWELVVVDALTVVVKLGRQCVQLKCGLTASAPAMKDLQFCLTSFSVALSVPLPTEML